MNDKIRKNKMQHLIKLAKDGSIINSHITDKEAEYLRKRGFRVENEYNIFGGIMGLYRIEGEATNETY